MSAVIKQIRQNLQSQLDELYSSFNGEHEFIDVVNGVEAALRMSPDVMPSVRDVAYLVAQVEDHRRCSMQFPKSIDMFSEDFARVAEIRLGEGRRVKWAHATRRILGRKHTEQMRQISADMAAAQLTAELMDVMDDDPTAHTLEDAMRHRGLWGSPPPAGDFGPHVDQPRA